MFEDKKILLGVTGGVAIYKVLEFVSSLKKQGVQFKIIMTESAKQMIRPVLFETIGNCEVYDEMFEKKKEFSVEHIGLSRWADAFLIAPATANTIAKINAGFADNLLTATALAYDGSIIFAQTMNENMLNNEITMKNIESLKKRGHKFIHSSYGHLACNAFGQGRMAEPSEIEDFMKCHFIDKDLKGKRVIITGGPTREKLDPVRFITNYSSGKMGLELAKAARNRGCITTFISGPICMEVPKNIEHILVESTEEMSNEVLMRFPEADVLIMSAAPADYRPVHYSEKKIKKKDERLNLELMKNTDILEKCSEIKQESQIIIGYAAETDDVLKNAKKKLESKRLDYVIANDVTVDEAGFGADTNIVTIISKDEEIRLPVMSKEQLAYKVLDLL